MPHTVSKSEKILIWIKDINDLSVIPLISAIQAYDSDSYKKHDAFCSQRMARSNFSVVIDILMPIGSEHYEFLFRTIIRSLGTIYYDNKVNDPYAYDCLFTLDETIAREIGLPTKRNLAQSYGIMLGGEASSLPHSMENLCTEFESKKFVLSSDSMLGLLSHTCAIDNLKDSSIVYVTPDMLSLRARIQSVFECSGVFDVCSFETHLAACIGKPVLEYNTDTALMKWSSPNYYCMTEITEDALRRGFLKCLPQCLT